MHAEVKHLNSSWKSLKYTTPSRPDLPPQELEMGRTIQLTGITHSRQMLAFSKVTHFLQCSLFVSSVHLVSDAFKFSSRLRQPPHPLPRTVPCL